MNEQAQTDNDPREDLRQAKILVVDDEPVNVALLERLLRNDGYHHITTTTDAREVLPLYRDQRHDIVLLDIRMPHKDGFQVMAELRELDGEDYVPVLVLTAQIDPETRMRNETRLEIIRRLGRAAEYRDNETGNHIIRMSQMAQCLARAAGLPEERCELILHAAPMHDIGKIGIPDQVLLKPGKLDAEEWEVMKRHVEIGAEILSGHDSELMRLARTIALTHHERWDGKGYPRAGSHFDPRLVAHFEAILPEVLAIRARYSDD